MDWRCFTCEHWNGPNMSDCEVCGTARNLYAEEVFDYKEEIKKLKSQVATLKSSVTKTRNDRDELNKQISERSNEIVQLGDILIATENQLKVQKNRESNLLITVRTKDDNIASLNLKLTELNCILTEKEKVINDRGIKLLGKDANIKSLQSSVKDLMVIVKNKKYVYTFLALFVIISIGLGGFLFYTQVYVPNLKAECIAKANTAFTVYTNSSKFVPCKKENIGARTVLSADLNNDGLLEGIVIASFDGINCKNSFESNLYIFNLKNDIKVSPLIMPLTKDNQSYLSFRGVENGKLIFDKWNFKDYNQKKYDPEQVKNSHVRMYVGIQNDSIIVATL